MTTVKRIPIISDARVETSFPWFDLEIDGTGRLRINDANGLSATRPETRAKEIALKKRFPAFVVAPDVMNEQHVLAITLNGDLEFVPFSKQRPEYYAHLGWYDPSTDTWELLQFIQRPVPTDQAEGRMP